MKMKTLMKFTRAMALGLMATVGAYVSYAQGYYDDDIYYDASKAKKEVKKEAPKKQAGTQTQKQSTGQFYYDGAQYVPWNNVGDYQSADTYQVTGTSTRDVDEYNRRTPVAAQGKELCDSISLEQFEEMSNTRNLARFHGSEEAQQAYADNVAASGYDDYYASGYPSSATVINLNVVDPFYSYPYYSYYSRPWYWNSWGYDPFWGPSWSYYPSWSWNWGWHGPSWGWAWGGPSWGWGGPSWGGPHPGWGHVRPTSPGAYAPNITHRGQSGAYRGNSSGRYNGNSTNRGSAAGSLGTRPSYRGNAANSTNRGGASGATRPGYRAPIGTPNNGSSGVTRGRTAGSYNSNATSRPQNTNTYNHNQNRNTNSGSYNYNSGSRGRSGSSSGFSSGGGSRGGYSGGGGASRSSGGGGHRGR